MAGKQCHFVKENGKRCLLKASEEKHFCSMHQRSFQHLSDEELMKDITRVTRSYFHLTPQGKIACINLDKFPKAVPTLSNLIYEAVNRGYRYQDVQARLRIICEERETLGHLPKVKPAD